MPSTHMLRFSIPPTPLTRYQSQLSLIIFYSGFLYFKDIICKFDFWRLFYYCTKMFELSGEQIQYQHKLFLDEALSFTYWVTSEFRAKKIYDPAEMLLFIC
jgi:hypothetical protein